MLYTEREYTVPRKIPRQILIPTKIEYLVAAVREENSATKFTVPGKEILPNIWINVIEEKRGVESTNPLKYLIIRVWNLLYKVKETINKPELTNPWANIIITEAIYPSREWVKRLIVTNPIWDTDEYAISLLMSDWRQVVKAPYTIAMILIIIIKGLKISDAIGNKGKEKRIKP